MEYSSVFIQENDFFNKNLVNYHIFSIKQRHLYLLKDKNAAVFLIHSQTYRSKSLRPLPSNHPLNADIYLS